MPSAIPGPHVRRGLGTGLAIGLLLACIGYAWAKPDTARLEPHAIEVTSYPIGSFGSADDGARRFGKLQFRGGLVLTSPSVYFGGFSGLVVDPAGDRMLAVSDAGFWLSARLRYRDGAPAAIEAASVGPVLALSGDTLQRRRDRDAEGASLLAGTLDDGEMLIAFEQNKRIGRYRVAGGVPDKPTSYLKLPKDVQSVFGNTSLESVTQLTGGPSAGAFVTFAEHKSDGRGNLVGWLFGRGKGRTLRLVDQGGFNVTDLAALPDGGMLVLERRFRWTEGVQFRLRRIAAKEIASGKPMRGEVLLKADQRNAIDNMEGLAVHRTGDGESVLTVISDDNFSFLQRTLLLQFTLPE